MTVNDFTPVKKCAKCKTYKAHSCFNKNKSKGDGLGTECRGCANAHSTKYFSDNREEQIAYRKATYRANPGPYIERARAWELANPERKRELAARYRAMYPEREKARGRNDWIKHNDKRLAAKKAYRQARPDLAIVHVRTRQTRKQQAMPAWADIDAIKAIYKQCWQVSIETGIKHHVDHFYPLKSALVCGLHNEFNLRVIPATENQSKGNSFIQV